MSLTARHFIPPGQFVRLDLASGVRTNKPRTCLIFNTGPCLVGLGGVGVTPDTAFRGLGPGTSITVKLAVAESIYGVVEGQDYVGEVDVLLTGVA